MISIDYLDSIEALSAIEDSWNTLRKSVESEAPSFEEFVADLKVNEDTVSPVVAVAREQESIRAIVPFTLATRPKKFTIGEIRLFSLRHRVLFIAGAIIGDLDPEMARQVLRVLVDSGDCDAINLYELPLANHFYQLLTAGNLNIKTGPGLRDTHPHWVIDFPESYEAYLAAFKSKTRSTLRRKLRQFENAFEVELKNYNAPDEVEEFLSIGQPISQQTYQWDLGVRLLCDQNSIDSYRIIARQGELNCYLLFVDGLPIAFLKGQLVNGIFHYGSPGFLRSYSKWSPGNVMLLMVIQDLIENSDCHRFDFGMGGDFTGYKSLFGNRYYDAALIEIYPCKTLKSRLIYLLDQFFWRFKLVLRRLVSAQMKSRVKQILRKIGILK